MAVISSASLAAVKVAACAAPPAANAASAKAALAVTVRLEPLALPPRFEDTFSAAATQAPSVAFHTVL
ncbi:hypothetical protein GmRootV15_36230 [Variovorax sp. V15]